MADQNLLDEIAALQEKKKPTGVDGFLQGLGNTLTNANLHFKAGSGDASAASALQKSKEDQAKAALDSQKLTLLAQTPEAQALTGNRRKIFAEQAAAGDFTGADQTISKFQQFEESRRKAQKNKATQDLTTFVKMKLDKIPGLDPEDKELLRLQAEAGDVSPAIKRMGQNILNRVPPRAKRVVERIFDPTDPLSGGKGSEIRTALEAEGIKGEQLDAVMTQLETLGISKPGTVSELINKAVKFLGFGEEQPPTPEQQRQFLKNQLKARQKK